MSDQDNMFSNEPVATPTDQPTNEVPEFLAEYVGGDKKYKTVEDALKSVPNAQAHIDKLEQELEKLRNPEKTTEQLENDIEERLLARMMEQTNPQAEQQETPQQQADQAPVIEVDDVVTRVKSMLEQEQSEKQMLEQQKSVVQAAIGAWGGDAEKTLYDRANSVGMSPRDIDELSAKNPQAALKILGIEAAKQASNLSGTLRTQAPANNGSLQKPKFPEDTGNDKVMSQYARELAEFVAAGGQL